MCWCALVWRMTLSTLDRNNIWNEKLSHNIWLASWIFSSESGIVVCSTSHMHSNDLILKHTIEHRVMWPNVMDCQSNLLDDLLSNFSDVIHRAKWLLMKEIMREKNTNGSETKRTIKSVIWLYLETVPLLTGNQLYAYIYIYITHCVVIGRNYICCGSPCIECQPLHECDKKKTAASETLCNMIHQTDHTSAMMGAVDSRRRWTRILFIVAMQHAHRDSHAVYLKFRIPYHSWSPHRQQLIVFGCVVDVHAASQMAMGTKNPFWLHAHHPFTGRSNILPPQPYWLYEV